MPKFLTYQRPAPVNKGKWAGRPGAPPTIGKPGKKLPKPVPEAGIPTVQITLPGVKLPDGK